MIYIDKVVDFTTVIVILDETVYEYLLSWVNIAEEILVDPLDNKFIEMEDFPFSVIVDSFGSNTNIIEFAKLIKIKRFLLIKENLIRKQVRSIPILCSSKDLEGDLGRVVLTILEDQRRVYRTISSKWTEDQRIKNIPSVQDHIREIFVELGIENDMCKILKLKSNEYPIFDIS